jgi:hypothetical protein
MKHWRRTHRNGWTAEVWLAWTGHYQHRTYESDVPPDNFAAVKQGLRVAQASADAKVPEHACRCDAWTEWL